MRACLIELLSKLVEKSPHKKLPKRRFSHDREGDMFEEDAPGGGALGVEAPRDEATKGSVGAVSEDAEGTPRDSMRHAEVNANSADTERRKTNGPETAHEETIKMIV